MILTITPNPTLDRAIFVRGFQLGSIVRAEREVLTPSGKGVDVSLVLHALGHPTLAAGLQAGIHGGIARELLDARGVLHQFVEAEGETRHALVLIDLARGAQSTISAATLRADQRHLAALLGIMRERLPAAHYAVLAGSLPPGWPADAYRPLIRACRAAGVACLLDTSGAALSAALLGDADPNSGTMPDIVKVNLIEFLSLCEAGPGPGAPAGPGQQLRDARLQAESIGPVAQAAAQLRARLGLEALIVTLGGRGAVVVSREQTWHATPPPVSVLNDAGAGDALAAGVVWTRAHGGGWAEALRLGTACAAAVVTTPGTAECDAQLVDRLYGQVLVEQLAP
jgi:1-phosphofructokinase family hexose kinase